MPFKNDPFNFCLSISRLRFENDNVVNMQHEAERLKKVCIEEENEINSLEHVLKIIERYILLCFCYGFKIFMAL